MARPKIRKSQDLGPRSPRPGRKAQKGARNPAVAVPGPDSGFFEASWAENWRKFSQKLQNFCPTPCPNAPRRPRRAARSVNNFVAFRIFLGSSYGPCLVWAMSSRREFFKTTPKGPLLWRGLFWDGILSTCGILSNCGFLSTCGILSNCGFSSTCGILSNCGFLST